MSGTVRTFIAVELSGELKDHLADLQGRLRERVSPRSVRWVQPDGIHLTLKFLGDTPVAKVGAVQAALVQATAEIQTFRFSVGGLGCFPNTRQPRVIWVGIHEPTGRLAALRNAVEARVAPLGFPTENRPFHPHLTLGRVQRGASPSEVREIGQVVAASIPGSPIEMAVTSVAYIKSDLRPSGAVYTTIVAAHLGQA